MVPRLRSDFWVAALRRRAEAAGAFVSIARRGAEEAGAIFVRVDRRDGRFDLYGPAPQSFFDEESVRDRLFTRIVHEATEDITRKRMDQETSFDPDLWIVDIEDREGRAFLELAADDSAENYPRRFTAR
jgi:hypothetical protein